MVMPMPNGATSAATASANLSMPHLIAWYIDEPGNPLGVIKPEPSAAVGSP
jgi:hypothetical protein